MPILYADCEGLDGGENVLRETRYKHRDNGTNPQHTSVPRIDSKPGDITQRGAHSSQRDIAWATTPENRKREYAVTQLYTRLVLGCGSICVAQS